MQRGLRIAAAVVTAALLAFAAACAGDRPVVGAGGACDLAADCAPGLVCVPLDNARDNGGRVCSNDLTEIAGEAPPGSGADDAGNEGDAEAGAPLPEDDAGSTPTDSGAPDTGGAVVDAPTD